MSLDRPVTAITAYGVLYDRKTDKHGRIMKDDDGHDIVSELKIHFKDGEKEHIMRTSGAHDDAHLYQLLLRDVYLKKKHIPGIRKFIHHNHENALQYVDGPAYAPEMGQPDNNYVHITASPTALPDYEHLFNQTDHSMNLSDTSALAALKQPSTMVLPSNPDTHHFADTSLPAPEWERRLVQIQRKQPLAAAHHDPHYSQFPPFPHRNDDSIAAACSIQ